MFEITATGYRATDKAIAFWVSRDTCPACGAVCEPYDYVGNKPHYSHECDDGEAVTWTRDE